jgi:hypothetical protein
MQIDRERRQSLLWDDADEKRTPHDVGSAAFSYRASGVFPSSSILRVGEHITYG